MTFMPLTTSNQAHSTQLTDKKARSDYVDMGQVRGHSISNIEKMTHPLAQPDEKDHLSPYMIDLLGKTRTLAFAEKALHAPRKRLLDKLGIDDSQLNERQIRLHEDHATISKFYNYTSSPITLTLNAHPFLEQEPTNPYFHGNESSHLISGFSEAKRSRGLWIYSNVSPVTTVKYPTTRHQ
jgi:hypothetical protein